MSVLEVADFQHSKTLPAVLSKLLNERQQVLVLYNRLVRLKPFTEAQPLQQPLASLCQWLMDYIALGHFEAYLVLEESALSGAIQQRIEALATRLYPSIQATTDVALEFNDRYDAALHDEDLPEFVTDLARLGKALAARIELEDRLIAAIVEV